MKIQPAYVRRSNACLHHPQDAEDACLTSWEKVIKNLDKIDKIDCQKTKSFLVIIVERTAIDLYRKNQKKNQKVQEMDEFETSPFFVSTKEVMAKAR